MLGVFLLDAGELSGKVGMLVRELQPPCRVTLGEALPIEQGPAVATETSGHLPQALELSEPGLLVKLLACGQVPREAEIHGTPLGRPGPPLGVGASCDAKHSGTAPHRTVNVQSQWATQWLETDHATTGVVALIVRGNLAGRLGLAVTQPNLVPG